MFKLSIITINRNNAEGLRRTMESVCLQTCQDFEYIVIDGASSDESVDVIKEFEPRLNQSQVNFAWLSEPDTGIYNAMNKGIKMARGEYTLMLNSGDCLAENDVVARILPELHTYGVIQGGMYLYEKKPDSLDYGNGLTEMSFYDVAEGDFLHQADFIRKDVYEQYGYYDESYRIAGDTAFFLKVLGFQNVTFRCVKIPVAFFEGGGIGSGNDAEWKQIQFAEIKRIQDEILGPRLTKVCREDHVKVRTYDTLHAHKWSWMLTRCIIRFIQLVHQR